MKTEKIKESLLALHITTMAEILEETLRKEEKENRSAVDLLIIPASQEMATRGQRESKSASLRLTST
jgi:hypothetical protein